ncbi:MAG TPA: FHA domain-containing protein [Anaerolineales bacterium]|nr:FHA domain-containing protein [Anaerolineales bacterium]
MSAILLLVLRILMAAALYGFLGLAIYTLLRDLKQQGELLTARLPPPLTLTSKETVDAIPQKFTKPEVILGRETSCDFCLDDPTVSSQHARLSYHHQQWWLEDMASTNGTYLNDETVTIPVVITHQDELRLGHIGIKIEIG